MVNKLKHHKRPRDANQLAKHIVDVTIGDAQDAVEEDTRDPAAVAPGQKRASKGGKARADNLTPARRSEIAKKAAAARWKEK